MVYAPIDTDDIFWFSFLKDNPELANTALIAGTVLTAVLFILVFAFIGYVAYRIFKD